MEENKIYFGDCLELMPSMEDKSVDLIFTDLSYAQLARAKWDVSIDLDLLWVQYNRIIKDNGAILLFAASPFDKILACSNLKIFRYEWIWEKTQATGFFNAKKMPMKAHENILVFYKNLPTYNPQKTQGHKPMNSYCKKASVQNKTECYGLVNQDMSGGGDTERYPRSVLRYASDKQQNKFTEWMHSSQKPLALCEYIVKTYTNEGDLVLDTCSGSGTTCLAAQNLNRRFIGMELEPRFYEASNKRLEFFKP